MTDSELATLTANCLFRYHVSGVASWPFIQFLTLLPTARLVQLFELAEEDSTLLTLQRREVATMLVDPTLGQTVLIDQTPLLDRELGGCLTDGLSPTHWYRLLYTKLFFWLTEERVQTLLCAKANRGREHVVLKLRTLSIVADYFDTIELSPIYSGATRHFPAPRGIDTFLPIAEYPYAAWR